MAGEAAALLDELMGKSRNVIPGKEVHEVEWWDSEMCKSYLCGFCPCDLFTNTRADIGICEKVHDEKLRKKYQESDRAWKMGYETQFLSELEKLVRSLDRRITHGRERLRRSAEAKQKQMSGFHDNEGSEKLRQLNVDINSRVMQLEELGQRGEVEGAQVLLREVEALEREREKERVGLIRDSSKTLAGFEVDANDFHEKMELCDVCGSFLVIGDSQSRVDAHLLGKQHLGYARIRAAITELKSKLSDIRTSGIESRQRTDDNRRSSQEYKRRSVSRDRRHRSRSRERRQRSRSREGRQRSHSTERRRRSRSRERRRRSRSREKRQRSRSREKRQRSRSREKRQRSRSRERRQRSRSRERRQRSHSREGRRRSHGGHKSSRSRLHSSGNDERKSRRSHSREKRSRSREKRSRSREKRSRSREKRSRSKENSRKSEADVSSKGSTTMKKTSPKKQESTET